MCTGSPRAGSSTGWSKAALDEAGVSAVLVDLGGDIRHTGQPGSFATVAVEHPFHAADNARPLATIQLCNQSVATSGGGRRGWTIGGRWYSHLLDPATGRPLANRRSASVIADTAADADAAASAFAVLDAAAAEAWAATHDLAVVTVGDDGLVWRSDAWRRTVSESH